MNIKKRLQKFLFVDFTVHNIEQILIKIQQNNYYGIILRKYRQVDHNDAVKVLKICKQKNIILFSHFENKIRGNIIHCGSSWYVSNHSYLSMSFHNIADLHRLKVINPQYVFISPVFQTRTHPNTKPLGIIQAFKMVSIIISIVPKSKIILLGGIDKRKFKTIKCLNNGLIYGCGFIRG